MAAPSSEQPGRTDADEKGIRPRRRRKALAGCCLIAAVPLLILAALHVPTVQLALFDRWLIPMLEGATGLQLEVESFRLSVLQLRAELRGIEARANGAGTEVLTVRRVELELPVTSLFATPMLDVRLEQPEVWLKLDEQGKWNVPILNGAPAKDETKGSRPELTIRAFEVKGFRFHFRRPGLVLDTEPFDINANLALANLQGGADISFGGVMVEAGNATLPIDSLALDATSADDKLTVTVHGKAPGLELNAQIALGSVLRFSGLDGKVGLKVQAAELPPGLLPMRMVGGGELAAVLTGSPAAPQVEGTFTSSGLSSPDAHWFAPSVTIQGRYGVADGAGEAAFSARAAGIERDGRRYVVDRLEGDAKLSADGSLLLDVRGTAPGAALTGQVRLGSLAQDRALSGKITLDAVASELPPELLPYPMTGRARVHVAPGGTLGAPSFDLDVHGQDLAWNDVHVPDLRGLAKLRLQGSALAGLAGELRLDEGDTAGSTTGVQPRGHFEFAVRDGVFQIEDMALREGPTTLTGRARLATDRTGSADLEIFAPDLGRYSKLLGTPLDGSLTARGTFTGSVDNPNGRVELQLIDGRIAESPIEANGRVELADGKLTLREARFRGFEAQTELTGSADVSGLLDGSGSAEGEFLLKNLSARGIALGDVPVTVKTTRDVVELDARALEGSVALHVGMNRKTGEIGLRGQGKDVDLARLRALLPPEYGDLSGRANLSAQGVIRPGEKPGDARQVEGTVEVRALNASIRGQRVEISSPTRLEIGPEGRLRLDPTELDFGDAGRLEVAAEFGAASAIEATLRGQLSLKAMGAVLGRPDLSGEGSVDISLSGRRQQLTARGSATVRGLSMKDAFQVDAIQVDFETLLPEGAASSVAARARAEGVTVAGRAVGAVDLNVQAAPPFGWNFKLDGVLLDRQAEIHAEMAEGALRGTVDLKDLDLAPWAAQVVPDRMPVTGTLTARLSFDSPKPSVDSLQGQLRIDRLEGRAAETAFRLSSSPAIVRLEPGLRIATDGVELDLGGGDRLLVQGTAALSDRTGQGNAELKLDLRKLAALFPEPVLGRIQAKVRLSKDGAVGNAQVSDLVIAQTSLGNSSLELTAPPALDRAAITGVLLGGQAQVSGKIGPDGLTGTLALSKLQLAPWLDLAAPAASKASGTLSATVELSAPKLELESAQGSLRMDELSGQVGRLRFVLAQPVVARLEPGAQLRFEDPGLALDLGDTDRLSMRGTFDLNALRGQGELGLKLDLAKLTDLLGREIQGTVVASGQFEADLAEAGSRPSSAGAFSIRSQVELSDVRLDPWLPASFPGREGERIASASGTLNLSGTSFRRSDLKAELALAALNVQGAGLELRLKDPSKVSLDGGRFALGPLALVLGSDTVSVQATGTLEPLSASGSAKGTLDLAALGELLGISGATGRVDLDATADLAASGGTDSGGGPVGLSGAGLNAKAQFHSVLLGPWLQSFALVPGIQDPQGLVDAELTLQGTSFRPEDLRGDLAVSRMELKLDRLQASTTKPFSVHYDGNGVRVDALELALGGSDRLLLNGRISLAERTVDLTTDIRLDLGSLGPWLGPSAGGRIEGQLQARGPLARPELTGALTGTALKYADFSAGTVRLELRGGAPPELALVAESRFPVLNGTLDVGDAAAGRFAATSIHADLHSESGSDGRPVLVAEARLDGVRDEARQLGSLEANARLDSEKLTFQARGLESSLSVDGSWPVDRTRSGRVNFEIRELQLAPFLELAALPFATEPRGTLSARGELSFPGADPGRLSGSVDVSQLGLDLDALHLSLGGPSQIAFKDGSLELRGLTLTSTSADGTSDPDTPPTSLTLNGRASASALDLRADGTMPLAAIRPFLLQFESMEGTATMDLRITGTPSAPAMRGTASVTGGALVYAKPRITIERVEARVEASGRTIQLISVKSEIGGGLVSAEGTIEIGESMQLTADLRIRALGANLDLEDYDIETTADATLTYRGPIASGLLQGEIQLSETTYAPRLSPLDILDRLTTRVRTVEGIVIDPSVLGEEDGELVRAEPQYNLSVNAPAESLTVESGPVNAKAQMDLQVTGKPSLPGILGTITVTDGTLNLYASKFEQLRGNIDFDRNAFDLNPALNLTANTTKDQVDIVLSITGRARGPVIELRSSQNQAQLDILQTLAGGSGSGDIGSFAERQVASFASEKLSSATGLEIELVPPPEGDLQILFSIGMRISERLFFKYYKPDESGVSEILELKYDATDAIELEGRRTEQQSGALGVTFRRRFD